MLAGLASAAPANEEYHPTEDPHYQFAYKVYAKDDYKEDVNFGQDEVRDGYDTHGQYEVLLPDGRVQTVEYQVSDTWPHT